LIGEAASRKVTDGVRLIVSREEEVINLNELRTMHLAPNEILLALSLDFRDDVPARSSPIAIEAAPSAHSRP